MQTLTVALANRSYPIHIGRNLITNSALILPHLKRKHVAIVTNTTVAPLYLKPLTDALEAEGVKVIPIILPDGEIPIILFLIFSLNIFSLSEI